jgi:hypothetical protein
MHDADKDPSGTGTRARGRPDYARPDCEVDEAGRYAHSRQLSSALVSATLATAYRAERSEELERSSRRSGSNWFSLVLVAVAGVCLIAAAALGEAWLLSIAGGFAVSAAALASCT